MRTTLTLDDDVAAAVQRLRQQEGVGMAEAVNRLIRTGLATRTQRRKYQHRTADVGIKVDVSNIGEILELLDEA